MLVVVVGLCHLVVVVVGAVVVVVGWVVAVVGGGGGAVVGTVGGAVGLVVGRVGGVVVGTVVVVVGTVVEAVVVTGRAVVTGASVVAGTVVVVVAVLVVGGIVVLGGGEVVGPDLGLVVDVRLVLVVGVGLRLVVGGALDVVVVRPPGAVVVVVFFVVIDGLFGAREARGRPLGVDLLVDVRSLGARPLLTTEVVGASTLPGARVVDVGIVVAKACVVEVRPPRAGCLGGRDCGPERACSLVWRRPGERLVVVVDLVVFDLASAGPLVADRLGEERPIGGPVVEVSPDACMLGGMGTLLPSATARATRALVSPPMVASSPSRPRTTSLK